jgi:energy-coupling factor transporter ATP-binding protein EcfA2
MDGLIQQIWGSLENKKIVSIQGDSSVGKSETMMLLKCLLEKEGKRTIYLDMRNIRDYPHFSWEMLSQLNIGGSSIRTVYNELKKGDVSLLLDEYWAGANLALPIVKFAHEKGNDVVTIAGNPAGLNVDEYLLQKRKFRGNNYQV